MHNYQVLSTSVRLYVMSNMNFLTAKLSIDKNVKRMCSNDRFWLANYLVTWKVVAYGKMSLV